MLYVVYLVDTKSLMTSSSTDRPWAMSEDDALRRAETSNGIVLPVSCAGAVVDGIREGRLRIGKKPGSHHALITVP